MNRRPRCLLAVFVMVLIAGAAQAMHVTYDYSICGVPSAKWTIQEGIKKCRTSLEYSRLPEEKAANNYALGELYHMNKQYDQAIEYYTTSIGWWHDEPTVFYARADAYVAESKMELAKKDYADGAKLGGNSDKNTAGRCWLRALRGGPFDLALDDCNSALRSNPDDGSVLFSRCLVQFRLGAFAVAVTDCGAALKLKPKLTGALYFRGLAKIRAGDALGGAADIAAANKANKRIADGYALFGITP